MYGTFFNPKLLTFVTFLVKIKRKSTFLLKRDDISSIHSSYSKDILIKDEILNKYPCDQKQTIIASSDF